MKTPAGLECRFFYGDYHRGRHVEACRLLEESLEPWQPSLCGRCPVPTILQANACPNLILYGQIERRLRFCKRVRIVALCQHTGDIAREPKAGCGRCAEFARNSDSV